jgi:hypothetical protein
MKKLLATAIKSKNERDFAFGTQLARKFPNSLRVKEMRAKK